MHSAVTTNVASCCNQCNDQWAKPMWLAIIATKSVLQLMPLVVTTNVLSNALSQCSSAAIYD